MPIPMLFSTDRFLVQLLTGVEADAEARVGGVIVDWEVQGKGRRQASARARIGVSTTFLPDSAEDLAEVAALSAVPVHCRLNAWGSESPAELESAIAGGADEILLPMVRRREDVVAAIDAARGRVGVGILVETQDAVTCVEELARLPISRVYIGLMDLALDRGARSIFAAMVDGTVERVRDAFTVPVGVGGLTVPNGGDPIPAPLLASELVRIDADFSFLRRSFLRDAAADPAKGVREIKAMVAVLKIRSEGETRRDRSLFLEQVAALEAGLRA